MNQLITDDEYGTLSIRSLDHPRGRMVIIETRDAGGLDSIPLLDRREIEAVRDFLTNTLERWDNKGPID